MEAQVFHNDPNSEYFTRENCFITEILNTKDYTQVSIAQARIEPGVSTEPHVLRCLDEIYYVLSGEGRATVNQKSFDLKPGTTLLIPRGSIQSAVNTGEEDLVFLCICSPRFSEENYSSLHES